MVSVAQKGAINILGPEIVVPSENKAAQAISLKWGVFVLGHQKERETARSTQSYRSPTNLQKITNA